MAEDLAVRVLEQCKISPPPNSAPQTTTLPLTYFDIPWLFFSPSQTLTFYEYELSTSHFLSTTLHNLKHSLSLALQHFFPFAGNLAVYSDKPNLVYNEGDCVAFTVSESTRGDSHFSYITSNGARDVTEFYSLLPELQAEEEDTGAKLQLLAVQVTVFPHRGICIGVAYHHVVADGRTFNHFIKAWASLCAHGDSAFTTTACSLILPSYDRSVIKDTHGLEEIFLKELRERKPRSSSPQEMLLVGSCTEKTLTHGGELSDMVRSTFVVGLVDMGRIKKWIIDRCKSKKQPQPLHLSPYVLTCAFVWVCLVKSGTIHCRELDPDPYQDPIYFGFVAGGITRIDFRVPSTYFGNCVGFGGAGVMRKEMMGEDGILVAASAIGSTIRRLDKEVFGGAEKWISDWDVLFGSEDHVFVSGSPKLDHYETDFGWGRPIKIEDISIDKTRGISLIESRDEKGGIQVGLVLPKGQMDSFRSLFSQGPRTLQ